MNENTTKINFSALKNNNTESSKEDSTHVSPKIENINKDIKKPKIQISLGKKKDILKNNNLPETKIENIEKKEEKEEINKIESINKTKGNTINITAEKKPNSVNNEKKQTVINKIDTEEIKTKENLVKIGGETLLKEPENLFNNYESDFAVKQESIIDKIKKLKKLPKTRPILVFGMLGFLIIGVSGLVFISPDNSYLKTSILGSNEKQIHINNISSERTKRKASNLKAKLEKEKLEEIQKEELKKEKLEDFLLNRKKHPQKTPIDTSNNIKFKKNKLKKLLIEAKKTK